MFYLKDDWTFFQHGEIPQEIILLVRQGSFGSTSGLLIIFLNNITFVCLFVCGGHVCMWADMSHGICEEVKGQLSGVDFLLLPSGFQESNSDHQPWPQAPVWTQHLTSPDLCFWLWKSPRTADYWTGTFFAEGQKCRIQISTGEAGKVKRAV